MQFLRCCQNFPLEGLYKLAYSPVMYECFPTASTTERVEMCVFFFCQSSKYLGILLIAVLVCSGCYNKIPKAEGLRNNRHLNLRVLGGWKPKIMCQHGWVLVKVLFRTADCLCPPVPSYGGRGLGPLWGSLTRALIPTERGPPS